MAGIYFEIDAGNGPVPIEQVQLEANIEFIEALSIEGTEAGSNVPYFAYELSEAEIRRSNDEYILFLSKFLSECRRIPKAIIRVYD